MGGERVEGCIATIVTVMSGIVFFFFVGSFCRPRVLFYWLGARV